MNNYFTKVQADFNSFMGSKLKEIESNVARIENVSSSMLTEIQKKKSEISRRTNSLHSEMSKSAYKLKADYQSGENLPSKNRS